MPFVNISEGQQSAFNRALVSGHYTLLLGSGVSTDSTNVKGPLPSAEKLGRTLCEYKGVPPTAPLQQIFSLLDPSEVRQYVTDYFVNCSPGPSLTKFPAFIWRRAFTFNIDDALEAVYSNRGSLQSVISYHFDDVYEDAGTLSELPLVHLHGYVRQSTRGYVFSRNQYIHQINDNNPWMTILAQLVTSEPVIVIGSSLDEFDLDYYMSFRTRTSGRTDTGPSVFVSPNSDALTQHQCETRGLLQFVGTCEEFLNYCDEVAPQRPTPMDLIPRASRRLLPSDIGEKDALSFWSDFELVPGTVEAKKESSRFLYGHPPSWEDLAAGLDVARGVSAQMIEEVERKLTKSDTSGDLVVLFEVAGAGKTTILDRCGFELARQGITTVRCTALSRLEPTNTTRILEAISGPVVVLVDNFADQVTSFQRILDTIEKRDLVVLASERSYRAKYIRQALSGIEFRAFERVKLEEPEARELMQSYIKFGLVGSRRAIADPGRFATEVCKDPVAVACCRILNDFRPLDRIVASVIKESTDIEVSRYLLVALARHCFSGGVRYSVISSVYSTRQINEQFQRGHPLPLAVNVVDGRGGFVVPQNATLSRQVLELAVRERADEMLSAFTDLGERDCAEGE